MKKQRVLLMILVVSLFLLHTVVLSEAATLTANGNGTVTDSSTNLMWQQGESSLISGSNAAGTCTSLRLAGYSDWRLPTANELMSIVNTSFSPTIDTTYFPNATANKYWTADLDPAISGNAICIGFGSGHTVSTSLSETWYVRCVRTESAPVPIAQLPSVFFTTEAGRTIFASTDFVRVGLSVSGGDLNLPAYLYLKFNQAANPYNALFNTYITTSGAFTAPVPIVPYAFTAGAYNLDCVSPTYNCLFEFPGSLLGAGDYSFTAYLGDGATASPDNTLNFSIQAASPVTSTTIVGSFNTSGQSGSTSAIGPWTFAADGAFTGDFTFNDGTRDKTSGKWTLSGGTLTYKYYEETIWNASGVWQMHCVATEASWPNATCDAGSTQSTYSFASATGSIQGNSQQFTITQDNGWIFTFTRQ